MTDHNATLERQHEAKNPLLTILQGAVAHIDSLCAMMVEFNQDDQGEVLSHAVDVFVQEKFNYLFRLEEGKLFTSMIIKVQVPLSSNDPEAPMLAYNEDRTVLTTLSFEDEALNDLFGSDPKMYVQARLWVDGVLQVIKRVENQPW